MREAFHGELAQLGTELGGMCELAAEAMRQATQALLDVDLQLAEHVMSVDDRMGRARNVCDTHALRLLALQQPVATDLRTVLAAVYCAVKLERMGVLAAHIADTARRNHPRPVVPTGMERDFRTLGELDASMAGHLANLIIGSGHEGGFTELDRTDDAVDALHADLMAAVTNESWPHGIPTAINVALLARFYERFADQAVHVAQRHEFITTGTLPTHS
ncbi:PhoU domain-containing protein [Saccharopolyspora sp. NPDC050642]|uniref:phosphate signaling complex PhoU family protein n=1 Tax=Saccharopolyspora sp. NPDC050642 TaxID=3157099 RepID=UPI0033EC0FD8